MKNLLFLILTVFTLTSCDKDGQLFAGKDHFPPKNQTGLNTIRMAREW